jgi:endoglucanase
LRRALAALVAVAGSVALVAAGQLALAASLRVSAAALSPSVRSNGSEFLSRYVAPSGRVVRRDQGGDTVSAGQSQALLVSAALGDRELFARVWSWTQRHLQLSDGLLASDWRDGRIINTQPASDADLDAARALLVAARRFHVRAYRRTGLRIARAILAEETVMRGGLRVLVAGPWARARGIVNPGYWAPRTIAQLAAVTGDRGFDQLEAGVIRLAGMLTAAPPHLPADWAAVTSTGSIRAIAAPPGRPPTPPQYGLDAARLPIRFAESCSASARRIAASIWPFFSAQSPGAVGSAYALNGMITSPDQAAITLLGAAAAAQAAGQIQAENALFSQAQAINTRFPTYYGAAWTAVASIELSSSAAGGCG